MLLLYFLLNKYQPIPLKTKQSKKKRGGGNQAACLMIEMTGMFWLFTNFRDTAQTINNQTGNKFICKHSSEPTKSPQFLSFPFDPFPSFCVIIKNQWYPVQAKVQGSTFDHQSNYLAQNVQKCQNQQCRQKKKITKNTALYHSRTIRLFHQMPSSPTIPKVKSTQCTFWVHTKVATALNSVQVGGILSTSLSPFFLIREIKCFYSIHTAYLLAILLPSN